MCGHAGFLDLGRSSSEKEMVSVARAMASRVRHRGPDDSGEWADAQAGIALGFRRLSIVDLSPLGHQPMASETGRYVIAFNGEIYNFPELRRELAQLGSRFRGHSDTEVMLAAFMEWGIERSVARFNGMFSFAVWDSLKRELWLGRDRIGKKPLYYGWMGQTLIFGSELKALAAHPQFRRRTDRDALALYFRYSYVPAPWSIYEGVRKVPPGTVLRFGSEAVAEPEVITYFSLKRVAEQGQALPFSGDDAEAVEELDRRLRQSVRMRMIAEVPLGAFLSGGVDSSLIVSLMQAQSENPVKTFTIGFQEESFNEAPYARAIAKHLGTDHTECYVSPQEAMDVVPKIPSLFDEPFGDSSQIPTYLVASLARKAVTVALSGDAGDELFGGYNRYVWARDDSRGIFRVPRPLRRLTGSLMTALPVSAWDRIYQQLERLVPANRRISTFGDKIHKLARTLSTTSPDQGYHRLVTYWDNALEMVPGAVDRPVNLTTPSSWAQLESPAARMMFLDMISYLVDEILVKVDRATMAVSLEARAPYLDTDVVEFAWSLPLSMKIRGGQGKWVVRQLLDRYVPRPLMERPKMGFSIPLGAWLRGPLRDWAEDLLSPKRLADAELIRSDLVRKRWTEHLNGRGSWQPDLWVALMYQAWASEQAEAVDCHLTAPLLAVH